MTSRGPFQPKTFYDSMVTLGLLEVKSQNHKITDWQMSSSMVTLGLLEVNQLVRGVT